MFESPVIPIIAFCAMIFGIVYINTTAMHRQRMAMIEKGLDPGNLLRKRESHLGLAFGLLLVGTGLGLFLGHLVAQVMPAMPTEYEAHPDNPLPYFMMVLLCGGAALIIHYFIVRAKHNKG